jgi:hypothetical protein
MVLEPKPLFWQTECEQDEDPELYGPRGWHTLICGSMQLKLFEVLA